MPVSCESSKQQHNTEAVNPAAVLAGGPCRPQYNATSHACTAQTTTIAKSTSSSTAPSHLQDLHRVFEVADVEHRQLQPDVAKVAGTVSQALHLNGRSVARSLWLNHDQIVRKGSRSSPAPRLQPDLRLHKLCMPAVQCCISQPPFSSHTCPHVSQMVRLLLTPRRGSSTPLGCGRRSGICGGAQV